MGIIKIVFHCTIISYEQRAMDASDFLAFLDKGYNLFVNDRNNFRQQALDYLKTVRNSWKGKPIEDRVVLYDGSRQVVQTKVSEDMQHGQRIEDRLTIINPFK